MRILFYGNGGSGNHGCEAIVRGSVEILGNDNTYIIQSANPEEDMNNGLHQLAEIRSAKLDRNRDLQFLHAYAKLKLTGNYVDMDGLYYLPGIKAMKERVDIALSVGGDNYCYAGTEHYAYLNRKYHQVGIKTVLWGCSIEPENVKVKSIAKDIKLYNAIVARESITYEAIKTVSDNIILMPDPAFVMKPELCSIDKRLCNDNVIGINISPHILKCESRPGIVYENYKQLIHYILKETDATVALIPHVVWDSNDDRKVLRHLYDDFDQNDRLVMVEDHTAPELKYIISKCAFFIGARTHATIAAYSSGVPTLVVGYSVKARGIARDLFGTEDGYVLPVQELSTAKDLTNSFAYLYAKQAQIHSHLNTLLPQYTGNTSQVIQSLEVLIHP